MLQFKTQELRQAASELGLTDNALRDCIATHDVKEAENRWDALKKLVKANYHRLALELHPDRNPEGAQRFAVLSNAYHEVEAFFAQSRVMPPRPAQSMRVPPNGFSVVVGNGGRVVVVGSSTSTTTSTSTGASAFGWNWWSR